MYSRISKNIKAQRQYFPKRQYTTETPSTGGNGPLIGGLLVAAGAGGYMYTKQSNQTSITPHDTEKNPMVKEKVSADPKKTSHEAQFEQGTNSNNKDTSRLVEKDTEKIKGVWEDKKKDDKKKAVVSSVSENNEGQSLWNSWFGSKEKEHNPMVREKLTPEKTKTAAENKLEAHAHDVIHDTSNLVKKDTKKVEEVWSSETPKKETKSFWSGLFGSSQDGEDSLNQAKGKLNNVKEDVANTAQRDARQLSGAWENTKDAAAAEANQLKNDAYSVKESAKEKASQAKKQAESTLSNAYSQAGEAYGTAQKQTQSALNNASEKANSAYNATQEQAQSTWNNLSSTANSAYGTAEKQGSNLAHNVSEEYNNKKEGLNQLHQEASDNASQLKNEAENKAKSWYEKSVDQIRDGLDTANREVFGNKNSSSLKGHVLRGERFAELEEGQLRPTRDQLKIVPARVVVEHARGSDM